MTKYVYSIRDSKTCYMPTFCDDSDSSAIRGFAFSLKNGDGIIGFAPGDFSLFRVGTFDTVSGTIIPCTPEFLCDGLSCREDI